MHFIDLQAQRERLRTETDARVARVMDSGRFILGPEVAEFEAALARFGDAEHALGCANGTDALLLALMALDIGAGDAVFVPSFTYCATAEVVALAGAVPVFVDVDRGTYNMDAASLAVAVEGVVDGSITHGDTRLRPRAVIAVDLFGQSADYPAIAGVARAHGLSIIADSAQGFGTRLDGHTPLHWADVQTTSFYPAKPLGAYGDGGAVLTDSAALMEALRSLHVHGQGADKYDNVRIGLNSRLDTLQAAILLPKLGVFADEIAARNRVAARYAQGLEGVVERVPQLSNRVLSTWAQYTVEVPDPDGLAAGLRERGIPTARYYPVPIHKQTAYRHFPGVELPNTEAAMGRVISLPMHPYLSEADQNRVVEGVKAALG